MVEGGGIGENAEWRNESGGGRRGRLACDAKNSNELQSKSCGATVMDKRGNLTQTCWNTGHLQ